MLPLTSRPRPAVATTAPAAAWGLANVITRASGEKRPLSMLVWSSLVPPIPLLGLSTIVDGPADVRHALSHLIAALLAIGYLAYVSTFLGFGVWNRLIGLHSVSKIAPFSLLVPVFGLAAAWLVLDEAVTWRLAGCAVLVLAGLGLVVRKPRTVHRSAPSGPAGLVAGSRHHPEGEEDGHARTLVVRTGNPVVGRSVDD